MFIHPERVERLVLCERGTAFGLETRTLEFYLSRRPALILPKTGLLPKNGASSAALDEFHHLASQLRFTVDARISERRISEAQLHRLCATISDTGMSSIPRWGRTTGLYSGLGAAIVEEDASRASSLEAKSPSHNGAETIEAEASRASSMIAQPPSYNGEDTIEGEALLPSTPEGQLPSYARPSHQGM